MHILYYSIPNLILLLLITATTLTGSRKSWKVSLLKLSITTILIVGTFFLSTYVVSPAILLSAVESGSLIMFTLGMPGVVFSILSSILLLIFWIIFTVVLHSKEKKKFRSPRRSRKNVSKQQIKTEIESNKKAWRFAHKKSRAFGGIIGFIQGIILAFVIMIGMGMISYDVRIIGTISEDDSLINFGTSIEEIYEKSAVGLFDKLVSEDGKYEILENIYISSIENISGSLDD